MSDRVAYPVGNTLGRDHQMWPCVNRPIVDADEVLVCNLDLLMQMAWRVSEWTVSAGSASFDANPGYNGGFTGLISASWSSFKMTMKRKSGLTVRDVINEADILGPSSDAPILISPGVDKWKTLRNAGVSGFFENTTTKVIVSAGIFGGEIPYDPNRELFAPQFGFSGLIYKFGTHPSVEWFALSQNEFDAPPSPTDDSTLTIVNPVGSNIEIPIQLIGQDVANIAGTGSISDVTITPTKWWPYKNSQNLPVYDVNTGAQLRDPFG